MSEEPASEKFEELGPMLRKLIGEVDSGFKMDCSAVNSTLTTNYFALKLTYEQNGDSKEDVLHVKSFNPLPGVHGRVLRFFYPKSNANLEFDVLDRYRTAGAPVPQPYSKGRDLLITEDIAGKPLEEKLEENRSNESKRYSLVAAASDTLCDLHSTGRKIEINFRSSREVTKTADLFDIYDLYFGVFCAENEELKKMAEMGNDSADEVLKDIKRRKREVFKNFSNFFDIIREHFEKQDSQLIHGDITTYHAIQDSNEGVWFIDFGRPKWANPAFDVAPIYFSQDTSLPLKAIEEIYLGYINRERRNLIDAQPGQRLPVPPKETVYSRIKALYLAGLFMNIRRASRSRFLKIVHPGEYTRFIGTHPTYAHSSAYYRASILDISNNLLREQQKFGITDEQGRYIREFVSLVEKVETIIGACPHRMAVNEYRRHERPEINKSLREHHPPEQNRTLA